MSTPALAGSVKGTVLFEGEPPTQETLKRDSDQKCSKDKVDEAVVVTKGKLRAHPYDGFWASMDTFKDKQRFEDLLARGQAPWQVWKR